MTFATSAALLAAQRWPLASTTRTELAPVALMLANEPVWLGYQVCGVVDAAQHEFGAVGFDQPAAGDPDAGRRVRGLRDQERAQK